MKNGRRIQTISVRDSQGREREIEEWMTPVDIDPGHPSPSSFAKLCSVSYVMCGEPVEEVNQKTFRVISTGEMLEVILPAQ